jgi:hypothetical protein
VVGYNQAEMPRPYRTRYKTGKLRLLPAFEFSILTEGACAHQHFSSWKHKLKFAVYFHFRIMSLLSYPYNLTFCVGAPRSGTTVISSLLSEGPTCFPMLPECTFITQLISNFCNIVNYADRPRFDAYARSNENLASIYSASIDRFITTAHSHFEDIKATELIFKDPELSLYLDCLPLFFEQTKIVAVVRNPKHVVSSFAKVFAKQNRETSLADIAAIVFNYYYKISESQLSKDGKVHVVQFEKIISQDADAFEALEHYLGYEIGRTGFGKVFFDFDRHDATHSANYGNRLRNESEQQEVFEHAINERIENMFSGYNLTYNWW